MVLTLHVYLRLSIDDYHLPFMAYETELALHECVTMQSPLCE